MSLSHIVFRGYLSFLMVLGIAPSRTGFQEAFNDGCDSKNAARIDVLFSLLQAIKNSELKHSLWLC